MGPKVLLLEQTKTERVFMRRLLEKAGAFVEEPDAEENTPDDVSLVFADEDVDDGHFSAPVVWLCEEARRGQTFLIKPVRFDALRSLLAQLLPEYYLMDREAGIKTCGSEALYREALQVYLDSGEDRAEEIRALLAAEDVENYTIKVHAMKSAARIIGAFGVSELALSMELAGKARDLPLIREKTEALLLLHEKCLSAIRESLEPEEAQMTQDPVDPGMLRDAYDSLREFAKQMDFDMCEMVLKDLSAYRLPEEDQTRMDAIRNRLMKLDWEGLSKVLSQMEE